MCAAASAMLSCSAILLSGCAGLVSGANNSSSTPQTLVVANVQAGAITTSSSQVSWTTDAPADSSVDYGTTSAYGNTTPVNSAMVTNHQITLSGLAAGTTYYFRANSADSKGNHGHGNSTLKTAGFSLSGTISPAPGSSGTTLTLSGAQSVVTTANSSGAYTFSGLASGSYGITPSSPGFSFNPPVQNVTISSANVTGVNFSESSIAVAPAITTQPASQTVAAGQTATFTVAVTGTAPLNYQWQKNGANITGATSSSYTTPTTTTTDSGSIFDVVVSNAAGSVTSAAATLTVNTATVAPTITAQPASQTVTAGQTATFTVAATGTAPLSYQWQKNGANIAGATSSSYTTPVTTTADSGSTFDVVVTNAAGTKTSSTATLTVTAAPVAPTITTQPASQTVTAGQTATVTVAATGTAPLSYQWQKNGANIAGATSSSYTTPVTTTADTGSTFDVMVSNTAGSVTSAAATLTVNAAAVAPTITTQPASQTVTAGQTATFNVAATGTAPFRYQWQKNGANIAGATSGSYTTPATATADSGSTFDVVVTNAAGTKTSSTATLTVTAAAVAPAITTQPASQTVTTGQTATFTVAATGTAPLSYQWQKNGANIAGATSSSYTTPVTTTADTGSTFDVMVSNTAGSVTSAAATLTVSAAAVAPTITAQPASQTVTAGQTASFTVAATGTAPLSYQWQKNGGNITGATSSSYTTPATTTTDSGSTFDVVVTNAAGTKTSSTATLTVTAAPVAPTITTQPASQTVTVGQTATLTVAATGTAPLSYQWQKNGANIAGATSTSYTTPVTTTADNGSTFNVVVSNAAGTVTSAAATLTVNAAAVAPTITTQPASQTVTAGQTATFTVAATGTAPLSYQWKKGGTALSGATSASYTTPATTSTDNGTQFTVTVSNTAGSVTSAAATLTVNAAAVAPSITTQPASQTVTAGQSATFTVAVTGTAPLSYQWQKNGANITGATSSSYTTPVTTTADNGSTFNVVVSNAAGTVTSAAATLTVNAAAVAPTITTQPASQTVTAGQTATFTVAATGTAPLSYQWQKNGGNITGATSSSYTTPATTTTDSGSTFDVVVTNAAGTKTSSTAALTVNADTTPPTVPTGLTATASSSSQINLSWTASTDNVGVTGYKVFRAGAQVGTSTSTIYSDTGLAASTSYAYTVSAFDAAGNNSAQSASASATTQSSSGGGGTLPSSLGWYQIPNTSYAGLCPNYSDLYGTCQAIVGAWGSAWVDTARSRMVLFGGGHTDYNGNEVFKLDFQANPIAWALAKDATHGANLTSSSCSEANGDGTPQSRHDNDGMVYVANQDLYFIHGGNLANCGSFTNNYWTLNPGTLQWNMPSLPGTAPNPNLNGSSSTLDYDPVTGKVYMVETNASTFWSWNPATNAWSVLNGNIGGACDTHGYEHTSVIDPGRRLYFCVGVGDAYKISLSAPYAATALSLSGCTGIAAATGPGAAYYPTDHSIVFWNGGNSVYEYNPDTDSCQTITYSGGPGAAQSSGTYKRWGYFPGLGGFIIVPDYNVNAYFLRLSTSSGTGGSTPAVSITAPVGGATVSGTTTLSATATDTGSTITSVQFEVDGANVGAADTTSPYNFSLDTTTLANGSHVLTAKAVDALGSIATSTGVTVTVSNTTSSADANFNTRCAAAGVIACQGFDTAAAFTAPASGAMSGMQYATNTGDCPMFPATKCIVEDTSVFVSGGSSMRYDFYSGVTQDGGDYYYQRFGCAVGATCSSPTTFGQNSTFYIQFAFRADQNWVNTNWNNIGSGGTAPKLIIVHPSDANGQPATCDPIQTVIRSDGRVSQPTAYTACSPGTNLYTGSDGATFLDSSSSLLQQGFTAPAPFTGYDCVYNGGSAPVGPNCFAFAANTWYTIYMKIHVGTWGANNSTVEEWVAPYGQQLKKWVNAINGFQFSNAGSAGTGFNALTLTQYMTGSNGSYSCQAGTTCAHAWYDELIISTQPIPSVAGQTP